MNHGTLLILKGRLLIEYQARQFVNERLEHPDTLSGTRITSHQAICLAQALCPLDDEPWVWEAVKKLNKMRNDIAHSPEPRGIDDRIDDLMETYPSGLYDDDRQTRFQLALWSLFERISSLVERPSAVVLKLVKGEDGEA